MMSLAGALIRPFFIGADGGNRTRVSSLPGMCPATGRHRRKMVGVAGIGPAIPRCHRGAIPLHHTPWSGRWDSDPRSPAPQAGGDGQAPPRPGRSPSGQPLVAYPRFPFGLVVQADFSPSTVAEEVRGQNLVRCEGDPMLEGAAGCAPAPAESQSAMLLLQHAPEDWSTLMESNHRGAVINRDLCH